MVRLCYAGISDFSVKHLATADIPMHGTPQNSGCLPLRTRPMPRYNVAPIVRPSDLKASVPSHVADAIRSGRARLLGFESQGDALRLLEARERTMRPRSAPAPVTHETARK